jgi:anti-anti-sigma factor
LQPNDQPSFGLWLPKTSEAVANSGTGLDCGHKTMLATQPLGNEAFGIEVLYSDSAEVALRGELDIATAPALRDHLSEVVTHGWIDIAIDIAELRYIDWPGVSVLIMTQKRVEEMGGSLVVRHPTKAAQKLFDTTGLTARLISTGRAHDLIRL